ncbi:MAG: J domain-containing protein [Myxococcales bacterium]|nr:J domain-containing protein [Myxococcales bacterium]
MKNAYEVLGVTEFFATDEEIKAAFRSLALKVHPDRNQGDPTANAKFIEVAQAYQCLSDTGMRFNHDAEITRQREAASAVPGRVVAASQSTAPREEAVREDVPVSATAASPAEAPNYSRLIDELRKKYPHLDRETLWAVGVFSAVTGERPDDLKTLFADAGIKLIKYFVRAARTEPTGLKSASSTTQKHLSSGLKKTQPKNSKKPAKGASRRRRG